MNWSNNLQKRWKVNSAFQVIIILLVFTCTGFTVLFIKRPLFGYIFDIGPSPLWASIIYYLLILPIYNVFLLLYGFIFGQFRFFWDFENRLFRRIFKSTNDNKL